jgi:amino acid permease
VGVKKIFSQLIFPASLLATTIVGAGMFALPYLFNKVGVATGLFYLFFFGAVFALIHLMYADIIVRTPENKRFSGYAQIYLGRFGYWSSIFMTIFGALLVLTIYLILSVSFMKLILPAAPDIYIISIFWLLGSLAIFFSINELAMSDFFIFLAMVALIFIVFGFGFSGGLEKIKTIPLFDFSNVFLPFGAVLFSMYGRSAIPALLGYFRNNGQSPVKGKWPIIIGSVTPAFIYAFFIFGILGLSNGVSQDAVSGLVKNLPPIILWILGALGIISLWSTYIVIGRDIKKSLEHDFNIPLVFSGLVVVVAPILFYMAGFQNFLQLVEFIGAVIIGLEGIFIVLMWLRASKIASEHKFINKLNPLLVGLLLLVFIGGILYKVIY